MRAKRALPAALRPPDLPAEGAYLWAAYCALDATRQNGMAIGPITHTEMFFYAQLHGFAWTPFELSVIRALDGAFLMHVADEQKRKLKETR